MSRVSAYFKKFDWQLYGASVLLVVFGLAVIYSTSTAPLPGSDGLATLRADDFTNFWKQVGFAACGAALALVLPAFNYRLLSGVWRLLYVAALVLLLAVLLFGQTIRGTTGWFGLGGFGVQPVELVKLLLIVFLAKFFSDYSRDRSGWRPIVGSGLAFLGIFLLVAAQPDFGSAFLLLLLWGVMLLMAGVRRRHLAVLAALFLATAVLSWFFLLKPYQQDRIAAFWNPAADELGRGYNVTQSIIAIGSGGVFGQGLGYGSQSQLRFLPERQTDFLFAVAAEELGFMGVIFVCVLFGLLFWRGLVLAKGARDDFTQFLVVGLVVAVAAEFIISAGGNLRLLPVTGVTLPFMSYGGSSLLVKFLMIGLLESVAVRN